MKISTHLLIAAAFGIAVSASAQTDQKQEKKEIIIEKKEGDKKEKMVIEIDGNKVTINGRPAEEYKGKQRIIIDDEIIINGNSVVIPGQKRPARVQWSGDSRPILGVITERDDKGVKIGKVNEKTAAEKAGLKEGDIITMINTDAVKTPEELTTAIRKNKVGDEIDITYLRDGKTQKVKATLGRGNEAIVVSGDEFNFNFDGPRTITIPSMPRFDNDAFRNFFAYGSDRPRYGMSIQDDEDGRGVKVTKVEEESNAAKAGLKEGDIITEVDGTVVKGVDDLRSKLTEKKDEISVAMGILRSGKKQNVTVKVPRRLKSANL